MPRAPRIEFVGAIYHVMNRGNHLWPIFRDPPDQQDRAGQLLERGSRLLGYPKVGMVKGMDRYLLAGLARQKTKVSVQWLATEFGLKTRGGMSYGIRQAKKRLKEDRTLRRRWNMLTHHETRTDP